LKNKTVSLRKNSKLIICSLEEKNKVEVEFWKGVSGDEKVGYIWDMVVQAMYIKNTPERLKFKKTLRIENLSQHFEL